MRYIRYKISISDIALSAKPQQGGALWERLTTSFRNMELTLDEFAAFVLAGHSYTSWLRGPRRVNANFLASQFIVVDMDTDDEWSSIPALLDNWFVRNYSAFIHTTFSHTPSTPRARIVFLLDEPITSREGYKAAVATVQRMVPHSDASAVNAVRMYYGTPNAKWVAPGFGLPIAYVRELYASFREQDRAQRQSRPRAIASNDEFAQRILVRWIDNLARAQNGQRNETLNRAAFVAGKLAADGLVDANEMAQILGQIAQQIGLGEAEVKATLRSGFGASGVRL